MVVKKYINGEWAVSDWFSNVSKSYDFVFPFDVGIMAAMKSEVSLIIDNLVDCEELDIYGLKFYIGTLKNGNSSKNVVIGLSGPGKVNAALCTMTMVTYLRPKYILNYGVVGAISSDLNVYDVVIADKVVQADIDTTAVGDPVGLVSRINKVYFESDSMLNSFVNLAMTKFLTKNLVKTKSDRVFVGDVATTDSFIASDVKKSEILSNFPETLVCDMELGAIAQTCLAYEIPFVSVKLISDNADSSANISYEEVLKCASEVGLLLLKYLLFNID